VFAKEMSMCEEDRKVEPGNARRRTDEG